MGVRGLSAVCSMHIDKLEDCGPLSCRELDEPPTAAVAKLNGLQQPRFIIQQLWGSEV